MFWDVAGAVLSGIPWWFWLVLIGGAFLRYGVPAIKRRVQ